MLAFVLSYLFLQSLKVLLKDDYCEFLEAMKVLRHWTWDLNLWGALLQHNFKDGKVEII